MRISSPLSLFGVLSTLAQLLPQASAEPSRYKVQSLHEFSKGTWVENLAIRHNGQILVTTFTPTPSVYLFHSENAPPVLLHRFTDVTTVTGITEYAKDVFGVTGGNISLAQKKSETGSFSIYRLDLTKFRISSNGTITTPPKLSKLAPVPKGQLLNGLSTLDEHTLLAADSFAGVAWSINTVNGTVAVAVNDTLMHPPPGDFEIGINGLHAHKGKLYFSNTGLKLLGAVPIYANGTAKGSGKKIASVVDDDFCFGKDGDIYAASNPENTIDRVIPSNGTVSAIAGSLNSSLITGPASIQPGRDRYSKNVFYVTTAGGLLGPVNGTYTEGGRLLKLVPQ